MNKRGNTHEQVKSAQMGIKKNEKKNCTSVMRSEVAPLVHTVSKCITRLLLFSFSLLSPLRKVGTPCDG